MTNSKTLSLLVSVLLVCVAGFCIAAQDKESGDKAHWGVAAVRSNGDYDTDGGVVTAGNVSAVDVSASDDLSVTDDATVGGMIRTTPTAYASVTNGQALTIASGVYIVTPTGGANDTTNTVTIANPTTAGDLVELHTAGGATNLLGLADSGNLKLTAAWVGDEYDNIVLRAITTSLWIEVGRSNN